ncbi:MAG: NADH-quinone oxidoreductase subunit NuoB [Mycobacteriales bacterium]
MTVTVPDPAPVRFVLQWGRRYALTVANVGLACCAVEFVAASMSGSPLLQRRLTTGTGTTELLVISGTVTERLAPAIRRLYDAMPEPRYVLSFGACANSGGPYWDSYCVTQGVDTVVPVDVYVPGCPPRPQAMLEGLRTLQRQIDGEPTG